MSNIGLHAEVARLTAELGRVKVIQARLQTELHSLQNGILNADRELSNYHTYLQNNMNSAQNTLEYSFERCIQTKELQGEIDVLYRKFKIVELANKRIRECNNKKYYDFKNYRSVRNLMRGMMDNLDFSMASSEVLTKAVEASHLQTPDYWLTCALIAVCAWFENDKQLARRSIDQAIKLDRKMTAIFFMLFNIRMQRGETAMRWFATFRNSDLTGKDRRVFLMLFSLICRTMKELVDERAMREINAFIENIIERSAAAEGFSEQAVAERIMRGFLTLRNDGEYPYEYPELAACCTGASQLRETMMLVRNNESIQQYVLEILNVPVIEKNEFIKNYMDEIIGEPCAAEQEVYEEIERNEMIIAMGGNKEEAEERFRIEKERHGNKINLISEMMEWLYSADREDINPQIKQCIFLLTKKYQKLAVESYRAAYRSRQMNGFECRIRDFQDVIDLDNPVDGENKLNVFCEQKKQVALSKIKSWKAIAGFSAAIVCSAIALATQAWWVLSGVVVGIAFGVFSLLESANTRKELEAKCTEDKENGKKRIAALCGEYSRWKRELAGYDAVAEEILATLSKL